LNKEPKDRVIEITNRKIPEIPNTGDSTIPIIYLLFAVISSGTVILITKSLYKRHK